MAVRNISKMVLCYVKIHRKRIGKQYWFITCIIH